MRIVIDLQACQSASRERGIGRYSFDLGRAIAAAPGGHEIWLALSAAFPATIAPLRGAFADVIPRERIAVFATPTPAAALDARNAWRGHVGERIRETFLHSLRPDIVHVASLFEGVVDDAVTSIGTMASPHATATTFYDLIPLTTGESLPTPETVSSYHSKLASLRRSDVLLALSEHARAEAIALLPMPADRVTVVSSAASAVFRPPVLEPETLKALCARYGVTRPFVMHAAGFDGRKNVANLVSAYARLPAPLRAAHQLVLVGSIDAGERGRIVALVGREGLNATDVLLLGRVPDETLAALYGYCTLFVLPSLQEGFGLPALEAMACGAPVIGSDATSIPEVIGRRDALFDPTDVDSIAARMHAVLSDRAFAGVLREHGVRRASEFSWETTARRALEAMEDAVLRRRSEAERAAGAANRSPRPKLAYVCPLPPERTGIAAYSCELLPFLRRHYDVELVAQQPSVSLPQALADLSVRTPDWLKANAASRPRVLYHVGNSPAHQWMFDLIEQVPGTVVLHDFFLGAVFNWMDATLVAPGTFRTRLFDGHGYPGLLFDSAEGRARTVDWYPCNSRVVEDANGIVVHSDNALQLASLWFGDVGDRWSLIPQLRRLAPPRNRSAARRALNLDEGAFVTCCFGFVGPAKLDDRLLSAWLRSTLATDPRNRLVFVGENHGGEYGQTLLRTISQHPAGKRVRITGFVDDDTYQSYFDAANVAVQLRGVSRGESPRTALDCLAHGVPLIANAADSMAALPDSVAIRLRADFEDDELAAALERLAGDDALRARLAQAGRDHVRNVHDPDRIAASFRDAIERFEVDGPRRRYQDLVQAIVTDATEPQPSREDWTSAAASVAFNLEPPRLPQLLVDVSVLARQDLKTGIERVVRAVLRRLLEDPSARYRVEPVVARRDHYVYARSFTCRWLGLADAISDDVPIDMARGDVFLGLDWAADVVPQSKEALSRYRALGLQIYFVVYDLLPLKYPHFYPPGIEEMQRTWLETIAAVSDGLVCISRSVAQEVLDWLDAHGPRRDTPLDIGAFPLGADIERSVPSTGTGDAHDAMLRRMETVPTAIMVGTVEPRKGHRQVVEAFDALWRSGVEIDLVILGKKGWMVDELAGAILGHRAFGQRLFWIQDASDALLERTYTLARVLIAASMGEGFGLPLVEAARRGLPIVARDLAVFREVAGPYAFYFSGSTADDLASALRKWLQLYAAGRHPRSDGIPRVTWSDSTKGLLDVVLGGRWHATWTGRPAAGPGMEDMAADAPSPGGSNAPPCDSASIACSSAMHPETAMNAHERSTPRTDDASHRAGDELAGRREDAASPPGEAAPRGMTRDRASADIVGDADPPTADAALRPTFVVNPNGYAINDFTHLQREIFVRAAFMGLLRREPDPSGLDHFVARLDGGDSKILILGLIRYSAEGRRNAIPVRGLFWRFAGERVGGVPIVGPAVRLFVELVRLPSLAREARRSEARLERVATGQLAEMERVTTALAATDSLAKQARQFDRAVARQDGEMAGITSAFATARVVADALAIQTRENEARLERIAAELTAEATRVTASLAATESLALRAREHEARLERIAAEQATEATRGTAALAAAESLAIRVGESEARLERVASDQADAATRFTTAVDRTEKNLSRLVGNVKRLQTTIDTSVTVQRASRAFARKAIPSHHRQRVVLDLQACQTSDSRNRGIGRYSRSLAEAVAKGDRGLEIVACLNDSYPESAAELAQEFEPILGVGRLGRYSAPASLETVGAPNLDRGRLGGEWIAQYAWSAQKPDLLHVSSVFEGLDGLAVVPDLLGMPRTSVLSATAYDLIPLIFADEYLRDPKLNAWYRSRLDRLRRCDVLLAISESTRQDVIALLKFPEDRIATIHGAVDARFCPAPVPEERKRTLLSALGLTRSYVMYTGGIDHRKNVEATIRAFGLLAPEMRAAYQMAIVCSVSEGERARLQALVRSCGLPDDGVVLTGFVSNEDLVDLYRCCELFVFPSQYEGFGLPVLEAMSCGAPTMAADASSLPEIVGRRDALFSIASDEYIAAALAHALAQPDFRRSLRKHGIERASLYSWSRVADLACNAWSDAIARKSNRVAIGVPARKPRLALVTPLHPNRSGIADFITKLLPYLAEHFQIDLFASPDVDRDRYRDMGFDVHAWHVLPAMWLDYDAGVLYQFADSPLHAHMVALIDSCPGVAFMHDVYLGELIACLEFGPHRVAGVFEKMLAYCVSESAVNEYRRSGREAIVERYPLCRWIADHATGVIVTSEHARSLMDQTDQLDGARCRVTSLPGSARQLSDAERRRARELLEIPESEVLVVGLGCRDERTLSAELIDAWLRRDPRIPARLVLIGEAEADYGRALRQRIDSSARPSEIDLTGYVSEEDFERYLTGADVVVQLRKGSRGEASSAALSAMAYGVPLVASRHGSFSEIPDEVCIHVDDPLEPAQLAQELDDLLRDKDTRTTVGQRGHRWVREARDPADTAAALASAVRSFNDPAIVRRRAILRERAEAFSSAVDASDRDAWIADLEARAVQVEPLRLRSDVARSIAQSVAAIIASAEASPGGAASP